MKCGSLARWVLPHSIPERNSVFLTVCSKRGFFVGLQITSKQNSDYVTYGIRSPFRGYTSNAHRVAYT